MNDLSILSHFATMRKTKLNHILKSSKTLSKPNNVETIIAAHALISIQKNK